MTAGLAYAGGPHEPHAIVGAAQNETISMSELGKADSYEVKVKDGVNNTVTITEGNNEGYSFCSKGYGGYGGQ